MAAPWDLFDSPDGEEGLDAIADSASGNAAKPDAPLIAPRAARIVGFVHDFAGNYGSATAEDLGKIEDDGNNKSASVEGRLLQPAVQRMGDTLAAVHSGLQKPNPSTLYPLVDHLLEVCSLILDRTWRWLSSHGSWPHVSMREAFVLAQLCTAAGQALKPNGDAAAAMRAVDMALILGAPASETRDIVEAVEGWYLETRRGPMASPALNASGQAAAAPLPIVPAVLGTDAVLQLPQTLLSYASSGSASSSPVHWQPVPRLRARPRDTGKPQYQKPTNEHPALVALRASSGPLLTPSEFRKRFYKGQTPVVLDGAVSDWAALTRWRDLRQLNTRFGHRTVPVEVGTHMTSSWKEAAMPLSQFLSDFLCPSVGWGWGTAVTVDPSVPQEGDCTVRGPQPGHVRIHPSRVAYLAQHGLLEQIPGLSTDMDLPLYAGGDDDKVGAANTWFGTAGTVTRCHYDSYDNTLVQVYGYKFIRLYAPSDSEKLYPYRGSMAGPSAATATASGSGSGTANASEGAAVASATAGSDASPSAGDATTAQGNISAVDVECDPTDPAVVERFPTFPQAVPHDLVLGPGDALFIPKGWWHYVRSLTPSFSVNFWY